ncbi:hypothetical protein EV421DRAFT_1897957 [Armillaria borealis]|uniref:Uncharacterized protein n=1 Tax=Armillaria borealis TaxID=47425 RepID=A0AA39K685_9AGAR|nr:hypothetical protein EV421DRAFT_1897957 [Armillaria borealis]
MPPDSEGCVRVLQPYTIFGGGLEDLEDLQIKFSNLHQGLRGRLSWLAAPIAAEYATHRTLRNIPPITVSIASTVHSLSGSVANGYRIDQIVVETLVNRPPIPPKWPSHLDSFWADFDASELYDRNLVLVAPGMINLQPGMTTLDWVIPTRQPVWLPILTDANDHEVGTSHTDATTAWEQVGGSSELDWISLSFDANFRLRRLLQGGP